MNTSVLQQEALNLFDQGIRVFLSDRGTKQGIGAYSKYSSIADRDELVKMCVENPEANLEVIADKRNGLVVLGMGLGQWREKGMTSLWELIQINGSPETLVYQTPDSTRYYLFKADENKLKFEETSGLRLLQDTDSVLVYPSEIDGAQVTRLDEITTIRNLSDWLKPQGTDQVVADNTKPVPQEIESQELASPVELHERILPATLNIQENEPEQVASVKPIPEAELTDQTTNHDPGLTAELPVETVIPDTIDALRLVATDLLDDGKDKDTILAFVLERNKVLGTPVKVDDLVNMVDALDITAVTKVETLAGEDLLFKLAEDTTLFHDDLTEPYFFCNGEAFKAPSKDYGAQLQHRFYKKTGGMPKPKELNNVLNILQSNAKFEGQRISLKNRVTDSDGAFIYDLRDKRYIKTTVEKWEIVPAHPLFRRFNHQQPQVEPVAGGDPWKLFNIIPAAEENQLLVLVYIISLFVPRIAHPVLALYGDKGSAKSFICTVINKLVDPTLTDRVILQKNDRDLIQTVRQKYVTVLDNLSKFSDVVSDILCQVCTGGSISFRKLYTDEGENIAQFRHVVILNSIKLPIVNADLMDRSIILKYYRISPEDRKPEDELWEAFEAARPGILGGIFDTLVKAKAIYPTIRLEKLPRLADFAKWGYAIAEALGQSGDQFIEDFSQNVKRQNQCVAESNVLCEAVTQLMLNQQTLVKSVGDTHKALKAIAGEDAKDATFPKLPHYLKGDLEPLKSALEEKNITFQYLDRTSSGYRILFTKTAAPATSSPSEAEPAKVIPIRNVPDVSNVPEGELPVVEFDEMPEVING